MSSEVCLAIASEAGHLHADDTNLLELWISRGERHRASDHVGRSPCCQGLDCVRVSSRDSSVLDGVSNPYELIAFGDCRAAHRKPDWVTYCYRPAAMPLSQQGFALPRRFLGTLPPRLLYDSWQRVAKSQSAMPLPLPAPATRQPHHRQILARCRNCCNSWRSSSFRSGLLAGLARGVACAQDFTLKSFDLLAFWTKHDSMGQSEWPV